jgi:DNA-binding transcriptional ArsR family regulator
MLKRLCLSGPQSTARLASGVSISRQAVTKHLLALEKAQIIESSRSGRERVWTLKQKRLEELNTYLQRISSEWDAALERLRTMVETK